MSSAAALAAPLAETALARWLQSGWVYPMVESAHILSIAPLVGSIAAVDLRLIGLLRHQASAAPMRSALPVSLAGCCGAVATDMRFVANAGGRLANRAFTIEVVVLLMFAGLNAARFQASAAKEALQSANAPTLTMRLAGALSLLLWAAVVVAGRL